MVKQYKFQAVLQKHEGIDGAYILFPYDVQKEFGSKGRVKVKAVFENVEYRGSLVKMGMDCHWIGVSKAIREKIGKSPGDKINVIIQKDEEERTVIIPDDFLKLLKKDSSILLIFEKLSFTHKKEYVNWINDAKKEETRIRRLDKAIEMLRNGKKEPR